MSNYYTPPKPHFLTRVLIVYQMTIRCKQEMPEVPPKIPVFAASVSSEGYGNVCIKFVVSTLSIN